MSIVLLQEAINQGADFIECDVVITKDLQLICQHENWLKSTTDIVEKFPGCEETLLVDDKKTSYTDCFSHRYTLAELRTLTKKQPTASRNQQYNGQYGMVTLKEYIQIARQANAVVGVYPELKNPVFTNKLDIWDSNDRR